VDAGEVVGSIGDGLGDGGSRGRRKRFCQFGFGFFLLGFGSRFCIATRLAIVGKVTCCRADDHAGDVDVVLLRRR
jgi:hypothetical protein